MEELGGKLAMGVFLQDGTYKQQIKQDIALMSEFAGSARNASNILDSSFDDVTKTVVSDSGQMASAIDGIGSAFTRLVSAGAAIGFVKQMFTVRSEMQDTESTLRTFLGSAEQASQFMKELQDAAYWNTFEFKDLAEQSAQMLAYGNAVESVIPTIDKLSNIASATSQPLERFVSIWNKVKVNDRLDSMTIMSLGSAGLDVKTALAEIQSVERGYQVLASEVDTTGLRFKDLEKIINHVTEEGGRFHGVMKEKMDNLGDSYGLLQDNITNMFNEIGEASQGILKKGVDAASYLVEHYKEVARILGTLVGIYGSYKAAQIAHNIAMKNGTGIAVLDNTVQAIRAKLLKNQILAETDIAKVIKERTEEQKKQIKSLEEQLTKEQLLEINTKQRSKSLQSILSETQKQQLTQKGLTEGSKEYVAVATDMLDADQLNAFQKAELSNNSEAYIKLMQMEIDSNKEFLQTYDERLKSANESIEITQKEFEVATQKVNSTQIELNALKEKRKEMSGAASDTEMLAIQEQIESKQTELNTAKKAANSAEQNLNTATKAKNDLVTKKQVIDNNAETLSTQKQTVAKSLLTKVTNGATKAFHALKAAIASNPIGAILTAVTLLITALSALKSKEEEATEQTEKFADKASENVAKFQELKTSFDSLTSKDDLNEWISKNAQAFEDLGLKINSAAAAQKLFAQESENVIKLIKTQAIVEGSRDLLKEKAKEYTKATIALSNTQKELQNTPKYVESNTGQPNFSVYTSGGQRNRIQPVLNNNWASLDYQRQEQQKILDKAKKEMEDISKQIQKSVKEVDEITNDINNSINSGDGSVTVAEKRKQLTIEIANIEKELSNARKAGSKYDKTRIEELDKQLSEKKKELKATYGDKGSKSKSKDDIQLKNLETNLENLEARWKNFMELDTTLLPESLVKMNDKYVEDITKSINDLYDYKKTKIQQEITDKDLQNAELEKLEIERQNKLKELNDTYYSKQAEDMVNAWQKYMKDNPADEDTGIISQASVEKAKSMKDDIIALYTKIAEEKIEQITKDIEDEELRAAMILAIRTKLENDIKSLDDNDYDNNIKNRAKQEADLYKELIAEYGNYADQRKKIDEQYYKENELLEKRLENSSSPAEKASIQRAINELKKQRDNALKDLSSAYLKSIFDKAFDPEATQETIKDALSSLQELDSDTYNKDWLDKYGLSEEDWEKVKAAIKGVKKELQEKGNTPEFVKNLQEIRDAFKKGDIAKAMQGVQAVADTIAGTISQLADALGRLAEVSGNGKLAGIASNMEKTANVISSTVSGAAAGAQTSGSWIGALVGGLLGLGTSLLGAFGQSSAEIAAAQKQRQEEASNAIYEGVQALYENISAMNDLESAITGLDYANIAKQLQSIIDSIEQNNLTAKQQLNFDNMTTAISSNVDNMLRMAQDLVNRGILDLNNLRDYGGLNSADAIKGVENAANRLLENTGSSILTSVYYLEQWFKDREGEGRNGGTLGLDAKDFERLISHNIAGALINYLSSFQTRKNDIANELRGMQMNPEKYTTMQMFGKMQEYRQAQKEELEFQLQYAEAFGLTEEQVLKLRQQIDGLTLDIKEANVSMFEAFAGTDIAGIVNDWISIFDEFGTSGQLAFNKIDQSIDKMIANMIRQVAFIKPLTDRMRAMIEAAAGDDKILQEDELDEAFTALRGIKGYARQLYERTQDLIKAEGISLDDVSGNSFSSAVKGVSEETAGIIAGQMNAIRVHQIEIQDILQNNIGENVAVIARNSAYLPQIYDRLGRVETAVNNSYPQRIGAS